MIRRSLVLLFAVIAFAGGVRAQEVQRIAAVVNDEIISVFDLVERMKLVIVSSGLQATPEVQRRIAPQVLRALIDERLRLQEAARVKVAVTNQELARAVAAIEQRNKIPPNQFENYLRQRGVEPETALEQLRAQIAWTKLVRRRLQSTVTISADEVEEELARLRANAGKPEVLLSEIFLPVASPREESAIQEAARRVVEQIRAGADFEALASQFSAGVSADQGGDLGWVAVDDLAPDVASVVAGLAPGEVSAPIAVGGGYLIVRLRDRRQRTAANPEETRVRLLQVLLPLGPKANADDAAAQIALANTVRETIKGCDDMRRVAAEIDNKSSGDLGELRVGDLPADLRETVLALPVGEVSAPVRTNRGIHLLMVCAREAPDPGLPTREEVRQLLFDKKLELTARRYLRDLRQNAFVDIRI